MHRILWERERERERERGRERGRERERILILSCFILIRPFKHNNRTRVDYGNSHLACDYIQGTLTRIDLRWGLCTLYLLACQVKLTVGDSGLCCCVCCVTSFERQLAPLCVDSAGVLCAPVLFHVYYIIVTAHMHKHRRRKWEQTASSVTGIKRHTQGN